jgi:glycolate oxidase iron-sulfur subunit
MAARTGRFVKPFARFLPDTLRVMIGLLPDQLPAKQTWDAVYPPVGIKRGRVALLTGCAQSVLDPDINNATIEVLTRNGVEVVVPEKQGCCGALSWHVGDLNRAQGFAKNNLLAFPDDVDAFVTNAAGCGSGMHEYPQILKGTAEEAAAKEFAEKVCDVSVYLAALGDLEPIPGRGRPLRVAYHDACHLANAQGVRAQPRSLLRSIPGVELCEIADAHLCCGSAGTYNIDQPQIAETLGREKTDNIVNTQADVVATGNIGCMTQLKTHLEQRESSIAVRHTMQVLRDAYCDVSK